jgi:mono/diheme cytochrome c family protein
MRRISIEIAVSASVLAVVAGAAQADQRSQAGLARGEHIARTVCSACHYVADNQEFPPLMNPPAPAFKEIANRPATTAAGVRHFVTTTHWDTPHSLPLKMPDLMLMPGDANDVARYLLSLRKP